MFPYVSRLTCQGPSASPASQRPMAPDCVSGRLKRDLSDCRLGPRFTKLRSVAEHKSHETLWFMIPRKQTSIHGVYKPTFTSLGGRAQCRDMIGISLGYNWDIPMLYILVYPNDILVYPNWDILDILVQNDAPKIGGLGLLWKHPQATEIRRCPGRFEDRSRSFKGKYPAW